MTIVTTILDILLLDCNLLFLKIKLNMAHATANSIPATANRSTIAVTGAIAVSITLLGFPS